VNNPLLPESFAHLSPETQKSLYRKMITIRLLEDRLQSYCDRGLAGDLHFNKGQEAIAVGVTAALLPTDHIVTHHRTIAHQVARGAELYPLIAELLGKRTGSCGGRAGEMHISNRNIRHDFSFQLVGTCIPVAAGLAWALKNHHRKNEVVAVFFGDAATSNGQFHEGLNIAAIQKLPLLLICENNHLAGNIRPNHYMATRNVSDRMKAYGIPSSMVDGNQIESVIWSVQAALPLVRERGPHLIECHTSRLCWHKQGQRDIRDKSELEALAQQDPVTRFETWHPQLDLDTNQIKTEVNALLDEAFQKADADAPPEVTLD